jgi:hypothetical protein
MLKTTAGTAGLVLFMLAGCAGRDFVRPSPDTFQLGRTSYSSVLQQLGEPRNVGEAVKNGKVVKTIGYVYAAAGGEPLEEGVIPARILTYYFYNDLLVGQEFHSSFKVDSSDFNNSRIESLRKGQTTRGEVVQILGKPTASFIPPMVKATSRDAIGYTYQTTRGGAFQGFKFFNKILRVSFDEKDLVSDVEYTSSGSDPTLQAQPAAISASPATPNTVYPPPTASPPPQPTQTQKCSVDQVMKMKDLKFSDAQIKAACE